MWYINATLLRYFFFDRLGNNILNLINYKFTIKSQHIISIIEKEIIEINENVFIFYFVFQPSRMHNKSFRYFYLDHSMG